MVGNISRVVVLVVQAFGDLIFTGSQRCEIFYPCNVAWLPALVTHPEERRRFFGAFPYYNKSVFGCGPAFFPASMYGLGCSLKQDRVTALFGSLTRGSSFF